MLLGFDVVHGHRTIFPIPLAEAAAFDPVLWERTARQAALEAAEDGLAITFAPMLDIARDPRWGRIAEGPGEDPWLASRFAEAKVRGFQGSDLAAAGSIAATAKHFCAYGAATAGLDYASVDVSERLLHEVYLPPFQAAVAAGCAAIMPGFNDIAGVPMTANVALLRDWLRGRTGFDGVVISDYNAIAELVRHGVAGDLVEAAALALKAGVDIDMVSGAYSRGLGGALQRGLVELAQIDAAASRVLALKQRLGLFDDPYRRGAPAAPRNAAQLAAPRELAREAARRAIVVLTNSGVLPLAAGLRRIAVIGPLAKARTDMRGSWSAAGEPDDPVTILEGLRAALPDREIVFAEGVGIDGTAVEGIAEAVAACRSADAIVMCLGEAAAMSGEAASRANPDLPGRQRLLAEAALDRRQAGRRAAFLRAASHRALADGARRRGGRGVVSRQRGRPCDRRRGDRPIQSDGPSARHLAARYRTGADLTTPPGHRGVRPTPTTISPANISDMPVEPQFPFGHGLSYGRLRLENLCVSAQTFRAGDDILASVDVVNEGTLASQASVFLFVRDVVASIARPLLELKGVAKIGLAPGERGVARLPVPAAAFAFPTRRLSTGDRAGPL